MTSMLFKSQGLIPRAKLLLTLGGTFFMAFWPLILITVSAFTALYLVSLVFFLLSFNLWRLFFLIHGNQDYSYKTLKYLPLHLSMYAERVVETSKPTASLPWPFLSVIEGNSFLFSSGGFCFLQSCMRHVNYSLYLD